MKSDKIESENGQVGNTAHVQVARNNSETNCLLTSGLQLVTLPTEDQKNQLMQLWSHRTVLTGLEY